MKKAIVLSGGGARGAYQIGVWKGLRKIGYKFDIVTGTSVGALNGVLLVQGTYRKGYRLWKNITFKDIFGNQVNDDLSLSEKKKRATSLFVKRIFSKYKIETNYIESKISEILNFKKFYNSNIDFGLITVNLSELKYLALTKDKIPDSRLIDYLIGSSALFPGFSKKTIEKSHFIDGGFYDNLPINLAIDMGATEIVAVDLKAPGIKQKVNAENVKIMYIRPRHDLGSIFSFDRKTTLRNIELGYQDTLKTFGKLDGQKYTFKQGQINNFLNKHGYELVRTISDYLISNSQNNKLITNLLEKRIFSRFIKKDKIVDIKSFTELLDFLGNSFKLNITSIYTVGKFNKIIIQKNNKIKTIDEKEILINPLKVDRGLVINHLYNQILRNKKISKKIITIGIVFPTELMAAIYLFVINQG